MKIAMSLHVCINTFSLKLNGQDTPKKKRIEMAAITVHVVDNDWSQLWLFKTHTAHSVVVVQQGRVK